MPESKHKKQYHRGVNEKARIQVTWSLPLHGIAATSAVWGNKSIPGMSVLQYLHFILPKAESLSGKGQGEVTKPILTEGKCYDLNICILSKVLGEAFGSSFTHGSRHLMRGNSGPCEEPRKDLSPSHSVQAQHPGTVYEPRHRFSPDIKLVLILGSPASRTVGKISVVYSPWNLWCFVIIAWLD